MSANAPPLVGRCEQQARRSLQRARECNKSFHTFISFGDGDEVAAAAAAADARYASGCELSCLDGECIAVKDNIDTAGWTTTCGTRMYDTRLPQVDATVVRRCRTAGIVLLGKTNMTELACGSVGRNCHYGDVTNPHDPARYSGGSSSGSAAAVAAGLVRIAIGSDTACSIRHPAAVCGVVGLKPTFGRVPTEGVSVCARDVDHCGPIAASVREAAQLLSVLQDTHWPDPTRHLDAPCAPLRVAILGGEFTSQLTPEVAEAMHGIKPVLAKLGCTVGDVDLRIDLRAQDASLNTLCADMIECYGADVRAAQPDDVGRELREWFATFEQLGGKGEAAALRTKESVRARLEAVMREWDVLVCATTRATAGLLSTAESEPREMRMGNCSLFNMSGQPSLTIPFGHGRLTSLPVGLLLNGRWDEDEVVLQLGAAIEGELKRAAAEQQRAQSES